MLISVSHFTTYSYSAPVLLEPHTFRLRPRADGTQWLRAFDLAISPRPAGRTECLDQDGNAVVQAWFRDPVEKLAIQSRFEVETLRENPFDYLIAPALAYSATLRAALAPYLKDDVEAAVRAFAEEIRGGSAEMGDFLQLVNQRLYAGWDHLLREEGDANPPETTLANRAGSCRDLAVLFCAICRVSGIAARFVSGYEREAATQDPAQMHAWSEVYIPGAGWRGYDPSQGLAVADSHVAIAAAADPKLAAPMTGTYRGSASARMDFAIQLKVELGTSKV